MNKFDVIVIGSDSGLEVSSEAAQRGLSVAVLGEGPFGRDRESALPTGPSAGSSTRKLSHRRKIPNNAPRTFEVAVHDGQGNRLTL